MATMSSHKLKEIESDKVDSLDLLTSFSDMIWSKILKYLKIV